MAFYANERNVSAFAPHLLCVIDHHPEAPIAFMKIYPLPDSPSHPLEASLSVHVIAVDYYERTKAACYNALNKYRNSPDVFFHAGLFIESADPKRALDLFTRAAALSLPDSRSQSDYLHAISVIYAARVLMNVKACNTTARINDIAMYPNLSCTLRSVIETSDDPALLCEVCTTLVRFGADEEGLSLIQRAAYLYPSNPNRKA